MVSCSLAGLYLQGRKSQPVVVHNLFMLCKSPCIILNNYVDAFVALNEMQINDIAIEIINNHSIIFENMI